MATQNADKNSKKIGFLNKELLDQMITDYRKFWDVAQKQKELKQTHVEKKQRKEEK